jgi:hypothetical protein
VILMRPGSEVFHPAALLLLVTAISNSLYAMLTRKLGGDSPYTTLFYSALVARSRSCRRCPGRSRPTRGRGRARRCS